MEHGSPFTRTRSMKTAQGKALVMCLVGRISSWMRASSKSILPAFMGWIWFIIRITQNMYESQKHLGPAESLEPRAKL